MDPEKLEKIGTLVAQNWDCFVVVTLPFLVVVSGLIIAVYQKFFIASLGEKNALLEERNRGLEKTGERHETALQSLRDEIEKLKARNDELSESLQASRRLEQQHERRAESLAQELSRFPISGGKALPLSSFLTDQLPRVDGGIVLFGGKLALPPLNEKWIQVSHSDGSQGTFKGGDLGIFQKLTSVSWQSIEKSLGRTLAFNVRHPPNIWTIREPSDDESKEPFFPYIQVSLISDHDADELMRSVREDIEELPDKLQADLNALAEQHEIQFEYQPQDGAPEGEDDSGKSAWPLFFERLAEHWKSDTANKLERLIDAIVPDGDRVSVSARSDEAVERLVKEAMELLELYTKYPLLMLRNCVRSLGKMPPETGLLIGRLLYYVFGVSKGSKVDIQQLSSSYEGAYARIRTELESPAEGKPALIVTNDYVLILATKSDFCLVHVHIPLPPSRLREMERLDSEAQNWLRNIRLALLK